MSRVEFWYEFASTYSYPAAMRIEALAQERGIDLAWRPFVLGPLFAQAGWRDSPFNLYPAKGRYMWRDMERICASLGLAFRRPDPFPQNSLLAARLALSLGDEIRPKFSRRIYLVEFAEGRAISERAVIADVLNEIGLDAEACLTTAENAANKQKLKAEVERAAAIGLFGAPMLVTEDSEIFWGNDRLEQGLDWAMRKRS
jgi:2-hydroxychromene-2-carboxylate isomerase